MNICALLVPYDSGHPRRRMGLGPEHLWAAIQPRLTELGHHTRVETIAVTEPFLAEISTAFGLARLIAARVREVRREGWVPLVLSGNCNASLGTVSGCGCEDTAVVWFDAHGEATTPETTYSGFLDGMGISMITGVCWQKLTRSVPGFAPLAGDRVVLVGARDVEPDETRLLQQVGVRQSDGAVPALGTTLASLRTQTTGVYLHLDLDVLDPEEAAANPWTPPGGLTVSGMAQAVGEVRRQVPIKAVGIASYAPEIDRDGRALRAALTMCDALWSERG